MKKRIITSFKVFETFALPGFGLSGSVSRKLSGQSTPDEMTKRELEALLKKAKDEKDESMQEEIEELISQIEVTELNPDDYKILIPPPPGEDPPPPPPPPPPPGGNPPPPPPPPQPPKPRNEEIWPPKGSDPGDPPPPGNPPPPGDPPRDKEKEKPNPSIIGKEARITSGPNAGQIGKITGITPEGKVTIQPY